MLPWSYADIYYAVTPAFPDRLADGDTVAALLTAIIFDAVLTGRMGDA